MALAHDDLRARLKMERIFDFRWKDGRACSATEWLKVWEPEYPSEQYDESRYRHLIQKGGSLSSEDFILMGRWKDSAWTANRWRPNVAMVAFPAWQDASRELLGVSIGPTSAEALLRTWSERLYPDSSSRSPNGKKRFGLSRATTLLHFMSAGDFPICDSRVRRAIQGLCNERAPDKVEWYLESYIPIFKLLLLCCSASPRSLDKALFAYGVFLDNKQR